MAAPSWSASATATTRWSSDRRRVGARRGARAAPTSRAAGDDRQLHAVAREREAGVEPLVIGALDGATPVHARDHPQERRQLEPAVPEAEQARSAPPAPTRGRRRAVRPRATVSATRCTRCTAAAASSWSRRAWRPRAASSPTSRPTASRISSGLDVVGALDPGREERTGEEEVERQRRRDRRHRARARVRRGWRRRPPPARE